MTSKGDPLRGGPNEGELAAIAAAIALWRHSLAPPAAARHSTATRAWPLAMRFPDLEIDDLRALARAGDASTCSTRF